MTQTTELPPNLLGLTQIVERLLESRIDTIGDSENPKTLVETYWLNQLAKRMGLL